MGSVYSIPRPRTGDGLELDASGAVQTVLGQIEMYAGRALLYPRTHGDGAPPILARAGEAGLPGTPRALYQVGAILMRSEGIG